jgi:predicted CoA-binding protein
VSEPFLGRLIADFVDRRVWAVVGASEDPSKFGHKIAVDLHRAGYRIYPVNPKGGVIDGLKVYPSLAALPETPEVVDIVVPPAVTEQIVREINDLGLKRVWMQPGAESQLAIEYCEAHGIDVVHRACAMVHKRYWRD